MKHASSIRKVPQVYDDVTSDSYLIDSDLRVFAIRVLIDGCSPYYSHALFSSWLIKTPSAQLFVQQSVKAQNKGNSKAPYYSKFARDSTVDDRSIFLTNGQ